MKQAPVVLFILFLAFLTGISCNCPTSGNTAGNRVKVLVVTGGHDFDTAFFTLFREMDGIRYDTVSQPAANGMFLSDSASGYDAIVFYDMVQSISERQKMAFIKLLEGGTGMVFLHHSLVSYQKWDLFHDIVGGKYCEKGFHSASGLSTYKHDLELHIHVADTSHPVTRGIKDFDIHDEGYGNIMVHDYVHTLLTTSHPDCSKDIAWVNSFGNSKIVYLMSGHDSKAWRNPSFKILLRNAVFWVSAH